VEQPGRYRDEQHRRGAQRRWAAEIFARGTDSALFHKAQTAAGAATWSDWESLGGQLASEPGVGINADGRLEVFIWGSDGALYHRWQTAPGGPWN
jgi:hypothetical protein